MRILSRILVFLFLSFSSNSSFLFLSFLESCVILILVFIFRFAKDKDKISSTFFMFIINIAPSILFMYFCSTESVPLNCLVLGLDRGIRILFLFFLLGLLLSKLPLFLFHFWLTKAHVRARGPGSIILASLLLKIGGLGFYKFLWIVVNCSRLIISSFFSVILFGGFSILVVMFRFIDLKYMVACSSVVHMAPIFPLLLKRDLVRSYSCFLMIVGHGLISYFVFFLVRILYESCQRKRSYFNKRIESARSLISVFLVLFFLMNIGFPPFISFIRELYFSLRIICYS